MEHSNKIEARLTREFGQAVEIKVCFELDMTDSGWLVFFVTAASISMCSTRGVS